MRRLNRKQTLIFFYAFDIVLVIAIALFSIPFSCSSRSTLESKDESMLDPANAGSVVKIELRNHKTEKSVVISREGSMWIGTDSNSNNILKWPCRKNLPESFIAEASRKIHMVNKARNSKSHENFSLEKGNCLEVNFCGPSGEIYSSLFFGDKNAVTKKICYRTFSSNDVWEIESHIEDFLSTDADFWVDPYIFPQCVTGLSDQESSSFLRHGKLAYVKPSPSIKPLKVFEKNFDNTAKGIFSFYEKDGSYIVIPMFTGGISFSEDDSDAVKSLSYRYSISQLTYKKFFEQEEK